LAQLSANNGELSKHNNKKSLVIFVITNFQLKSFKIISSFCVVNKKHDGYGKSK
jgi:hypothetical protein